MKIQKLAPLSLLISSTAFAAPIPVNVENFVRAESDLYIQVPIKAVGLGKFDHYRKPVAIDAQTVVRLNRDTLYSSATFDLNAGPVTITLPDAGKRFMSMQVISEDQYTPLVVYKPGKHTITKDLVGTRYAIVAIRTFVNPDDKKDLESVHKLQDAIQISQPGGPGKFEIPDWDPTTQKEVRNALIKLNNTLPNTNYMFGTKSQVKPILHLIGSAAAWGGNPQKDATYLNVTPTKNDGKTTYTIKVPKDVPVKGFWSISVYNKDGYFEKNSLNSYTLNNITAKQSQDGSYNIQFGDCTKTTTNCLPIVNGWNYMVRLYQPNESILNGTWKFPVAQPK